MAKKIVIALGGNALGSTLHEQADAVQITARAIVDLIAEGHEVIVAHGNGPQVGIINNAMLALMHEDPRQDSTPLSVCGAMSQAYIGYDLQNALHEEMMNRGIDEPVVTMVTQVEVDPNDPAFNDPSKPIGKFLSEEEAKVMAAKTGFLFKEDAGPGRGPFSTAMWPPPSPSRSWSWAPSAPSATAATSSSAAAAAASPSTVPSVTT